MQKVKKFRGLRSPFYDISGYMILVLIIYNDNYDISGCMILVLIIYYDISRCMILVLIIYYDMSGFVDTYHIWY